MSTHCLNCDTALQGSYCHQCGQKASTHRITFGKFIQHDLLHGIFHLDKGILYTLKQLVYRPGYAAKGFIAGQRVAHYNIIALFIITVVLRTLVNHQISEADLFTSHTEQNKSTDVLLNETARHYYKFFYLMVIPLISVFSYLWLKKLRYNFTEHLVINCFFLTGAFMYSLLIMLVSWATHIGLGGLADLVSVLYFFISYYQLSKGSYSFLNYLWRNLLMLLCFILGLLLVFLIVVLVFYNGSFKGTTHF